VVKLILVSKRSFFFRGPSFFSLLAVFVFLALGCTKQSKNELVVGAVLPMTGDSAQYGDAMSKGTKLAIDEYNASKPAVPIKLVVEDSQGKPKEGLNATTKLVKQDNAQAILIAFSGVIMSSLPVATDNKVVMVNGPANSPKLRGASPYLFNVAVLSDQEGKYLAETAYNKLGGRRVAIFYTDNDSGKGFMQVFSDRFKELGGEVVLAEPHQQNANDFRTSIQKAKRCKPDLAFIAAYYKEGAFLLTQADEAGFKPKWLSYAAIESPELIKIAGKSAEGLVFSQVGFDKSKPTDSQTRFINAFKAKYNEDPGVWAAQFYDAATVATNSLKQFTQKPTGEQLRNAIASAATINGAGGPVSFDAQGLNKRDVLLKTVNGGRFALWTVSR
jgi:branched-chain amino acid transport system substrate-binding protein